MTTNELRIGNWVTWKQNGKPVQLKGIRPEFIQTDPTTLGGVVKNYSPIPLTPEILAKVGFKFDNRLGVYLHEDDLAGIHILENSDRFLVEFYYSFLELRHLHQLQNLFFVLTGQELNYTP
jgi:hypothetical protein